MKKHVVTITILAALLRFPHLSQFPAFWPDDEPGHAYDSYSILKTGKSFRGEPFPLVLKHFSTKQPSPAILYSYLQIPSVAVFGLTELGARFPAALLGTITTVVLYGLTYLFTRNKYISLFAGLFLAISPWHISLSRHGLEAVTFPLLFLSGWYFLQKNPATKASCLFAGICLGLSFSSYQVATLMTPLLLLISFLMSKHSFVTKKRIVLSTLIFSLPFIAGFFLTKGDIFNHYQDVSVINYSASTKWSTFATFMGSQLLPISAYYYYLLPIIFLGYVGLMKIIKSRQVIRFNQLLIVSLFSLIPSALTTDTIQLNVNRSVAKTGLLEILAAFAAYQIIKSKNKKLILATSLFSILNIVSIIKSNPYYYLQDNNIQRQIKPAIQYVIQHSNEYQNIVITKHLNQPFMYVLFYAKIPPELFQQIEIVRTTENHQYAYDYVIKMDKYKFCSLNDCYQPDQSTLYLGYTEEKINIKSTVKFGTEKNSLRILDNMGGEGEI